MRSSKQARQRSRAQAAAAVVGIDAGKFRYRLRVPSPRRVGLEMPHLLTTRGVHHPVRQPKRPLISLP
jgi:hypothetical protein